MASTMIQPTAGPGDEIPLWARRDWDTAYLRVKGKIASVRLWDRVLTAEDRQRLGKDLDAAYLRHRGAVGMWVFLHGVSVPRAVVAVAVRIGFLDVGTGQALLRALGEVSDDPEGTVDSAVAAGGLVLVEMPRQAFWGGELVEVDWARHTGSWELLWTLARVSKSGGVVDAETLQERHVTDPGFMRKRKCRLVKTDGFPTDLACLVVSVGRGTYRLNLPSSRIRVFERGIEDAVREWTP